MCSAGPILDGVQGPAGTNETSAGQNPTSIHAAAEVNRDNGPDQAFEKQAESAHASQSPPGSVEPDPPHVRPQDIPFVITHAMKEALRARGMSDDEIANLTPQQAHEISHKPNGGAPSSASGFLQKLRPGGPWMPVAIVPGRTPTAITAHTADQVEAYVREHDGNANLYYGLNPTRTTINKKAKKTDIAAIEYIPLDLDSRADETPEAAKARYLAQLNGSFEPKLAFLSTAAMVSTGACGSTHGLSLASRSNSRPRTWRRSPKPKPSPRT
jgi:hypothetical protein